LRGMIPDAWCKWSFEIRMYATIMTSKTKGPQTGQVTGPPTRELEESIGWRGAEQRVYAFE
jgi:hypothetical protein